MEIPESIKSIFKSQFHVIGEHIFKLPHYNKHGISLVVLYICEHLDCENDVCDKDIKFVISDVEYIHCIEPALDMGYNVSAVIDGGNGCEELKLKLLKLKESFNEHLNIYIHDLPLQEHYIIFKNIVIREFLKNIDGCWSYATIISGASDNFVEHEVSNFLSIRSDSKVVGNISIKKNEKQYGTMKITRDKEYYDGLGKVVEKHLFGIVKN